jgi:hypothetical protein
MKHATILFAAILAAACVKEQTTTTTAVVGTPVPAPEVSLTPTPQPSPAAPARNVPGFAPRDEASSDPSFAAYREQLRAAVRAKDWTAMEKLIDPKIRTSFGGSGGTADFRDRLDNKGMWQELDSILAMGGTFRELDRGQQQFCAPYVFSAWPEERDSFEHLAVIRDGAPLHGKNDPNSAVLATLRHEFVRIGGEDPLRNGVADPEWRHVETADGLSGWVKDADVRSPIDYRACFTKRSGEWKMDLLVAGD